MRCDLHVHTIHSGRCSIPLLKRVCRESYNDPGEVYETLKRRGMDLVTITDHDSIGAVESLRSRPDFFLSEEVSCSTPGGTHLHMGVYGIEDRDHTELQRRRDDMPSLLAYLGERKLLFSVNHVFSALTGPRNTQDFEEFERSFPAVETLNGQMLAIANRHAAGFSERAHKIAVGGSDAHTMQSLGRTYTEVAGARDARAFLDGLRAGRGTVAGESGSYWKLTRAIWEIASSFMRERRAALLLAPLVTLIPVVTFANLVLEFAFARRWGRQIAGHASTGKLVRPQQSFEIPR